MYKTYKRFLSMILAVATMFVFFVTPTGAENLSSKVFQRITKYFYGRITSKWLY